MIRRRATRLSGAAPLCLGLLLTGCSSSGYWILDPQGPVARSSLNSLLIDVGAMLSIIGPTTLLLAWCVWRYRRASGRGTYMPNWSHSLLIEIVSWGFPAAIVVFLGYYSYRGTFAVNPFGPGVLANAPSADAPAVDVDVVTTDWQWLFVYPRLHIASANELVIPVHTQVHFRLTSSTVTNDFFIPQLAGQIDIMPGMRTKQSLFANHVGTYQGFSSDFSGPGFSWMRFTTHVVTRADFDAWTEKAAQAPTHLTMASFNRFAKPTINIRGATGTFSNVADGFFDNIVREVDRGTLYITPRSMTDKSTYTTGNGVEPTH